MKTFRKFSITTRLLSVNITIILFAFLGVLLGFNLLISSYIASSVTQQVSQTVTAQSLPPTRPSSASSNASASSKTNLPDLANASSGRFNLRPYVFQISTDYTVENSQNIQGFELQNAQNIVGALKNNHVSLNNLKNYRLKTNLQTSPQIFYIETVKVGKSYLLYYTDITGIENFTSSVNVYLLLVMLAVLVFTSITITFTTRRITGPLGRLSNFARRIGKGNFTQDLSGYHGRELMILSDNLNEAASQLSKNDENQKTFFQNASHELRTPLMAIKSYAEGISYDVIEPKTAASTILKETDDMTELVEDLLTMSRLDTLNLDKEARQSTDLRELIQDVANEQKPLADKLGLNIVCDLNKKAVFRLINYKAMRRAVSNLVSNALRYAKTTVTLSVSSDGEMTVSNDGSTIEKKDMAHIFERFYKGKGGVHGIGLSIVKAVVEQHDGTVSVSSDEKLTSFSIFVPLKKEAGQDRKM